MFSHQCIPFLTESLSYAFLILSHLILSENWSRHTQIPIGSNHSRYEETIFNFEPGWQALLAKWNAFEVDSCIRILTFNGAVHMREEDSQ